MNPEAAISLIITVILALAGYLITYLNNLRLAVGNNGFLTITSYQNKRNGSYIGG